MIEYETLRIRLTKVKRIKPAYCIGDGFFGSLYMDETWGAGVKEAKTNQKG